MGKEKNAPRSPKEKGKKRWKKKRKGPLNSVHHEGSIRKRTKKRRGKKGGTLAILSFGKKGRFRLISPLE